MSGQRDPTIDAQVHAGDEAAFATGQHQRRRCNLVGTPNATKRNGTCHICLERWPVALGNAELGQDRRIDGTWADDVHPNATRLELERPALRKRFNCRFCAA